MTSNGVSFTVVPPGTPPSIVYHLHQEAGSSSGTDLLSTAGPDAPYTFLQTGDLKGQTFQFMVFVGNFTTLTGVPGIIPANTTVTFSMWLKETASVSGIYPAVSLSTVNGPSLCSQTLTNQFLTTTLTKYTFTCTVPSVVTLSSSYPLQLLVMVGWTGTIRSSVHAQVYFEGTLNGNYDSEATLPEFLAPVISTVSPSSGIVGTSVTVSGSAFGATQGSSTLTFNGVAATPTSWNDTTIVAPVPANASSGPLVVTVNTVASNAVNFTVPPFISGLSPAAGPVGTSVTINGTTFGSSQGSSRLNFNGVPAAPTSWNNTSIVAPVPPGASTGPVTVNVGGTVSNGVNFTVTPLIVRISPSFAPVGAQVNLRGYNFGSSQGSSAVTFNGISASPVSWTDNSVVVPVPAGVSNGPVIVTAGGYASNPINFAVSPSISGISPVSGTSGTSVTISGSNFGTTQGSSSVLFNGVPGTPSSWSNTSIVVPAPTGVMTGPVTVVVNGASSNGVIFSVDPAISAISPSSGVSGTVVTIAGSNFGGTQGPSYVQFNSVLAAPTSWSNTKIVTPVPAGASSGPVRVTVNNIPSNAVTFTIGLGTIAGTVSQAGNGSAVAGALVEAIEANAVIGSATTASDGSYSINNLPGGNYDVLVSANGFGTTLKTSNGVNANATTTVNVSLPSPGTISGQVTQGNGTGINGATVTVSQSGDTVTTANTDASGNYSIASLAPGTYTAQASASGYNAQTQNSLTVTTGNVTTATFSLSGQSTITYTYDELGRLVGTVDSQSDAVTYNYDAVGNLLSIGRTHSNQVSIIGFIPKSGPVGTTVTISGTAFSTTPSQNSVTFNGTQATVTSATTTQLVVTVPSGATTGIISVTSPAGTANSANAFTVTTGGTGAPTITSFSPGSGVPGNAITVSGTNFDPTPANDTLKFNLTSARVSSATGTSFSTSVPTLVSSGRLSIITKAGSAASSQDFYVPFGNYAASAIGFTARMALNTTQNVSIGTAGQIGLVLFDGVAGQEISASISNSTFSTCWFFLIDPYGRQVTDSNRCTGSSQFMGEQTLAYTGTYTLGFDPSSTTGSLSLTLNGFSNQTGVLIPGVPTTLTTSYPGQGATYTFGGTAGQIMSLAVTGSTFPCNTMSYTVLSPAGTVLASQLLCSNSGSANNQTLPITGTYKVVISTSSTPGSATLTLTQNIAGPLAFNNPLTVSNTLAGQVWDLTFSGTAGQLISLAATSITYPCNTMVFSILNPDGTTLASNLECSSHTSFNNQTLPQTGTYIVLVNTGSSMGSATFTLTQTISEPISFGTPLTLSNTLAGQVWDLTFSGTAGQLISLAATSITYPCNNMSFTILNPNGTTLDSNLECSSHTSLNNETLPQTGTYTVLVNTGSSTGSATFTLTQNIAGSISFNSPLTVSNTLAGQVWDLTFSGSAGQLISLAATGITYPCNNMVFSILKPDGTTLASNLECSSQTSINNETLPQTGTYTILVNTGSSTGSATFTLTQNISEPISFGTPLTVSNTLAGQVWDLTFSGTSGQTVSVSANSVTYPCNTMVFSILNPDGSTLASDLICGSSGSLNNKSLATTGTYTILVNSGSSTGSATFTLTSP